MSWWKMCVLLLSLFGVAVWAAFRLDEERLVPRRQQVAAAEKRLANLKLLSEDDVTAMTGKANDSTAKAMAISQQLKQDGIAELPQGQESVIAVQQAVMEALVRRKIRVLKTSATTRLDAPKSSRSPAAPKVPERKMSAAEYEAESMKVAATLDAKMRAEFLQGVKAKVAQIKSAEAKQAKRTASVVPVVPPVARTVRAAPFKTENLVYEAEGSFKDMFLFFVDESHKKLGYDFSDITVSHSDAAEGLMRLSFTLRVNYR